MNLKRIFRPLVPVGFCVAGLVCFAGCKRETPDAKSGASKQLTVTISEAPSTSGPVAALDVGSAHLLNAIHAPLIVVGPDGKLGMVLAGPGFRPADCFGADGDNQGRQRQAAKEAFCPAYRWRGAVETGAIQSWFIF